MLENTVKTLYRKKYEKILELHFVHTWCQMQSE